MIFNNLDNYSITISKDQLKQLLREIIIEEREPFIAALKGYVHEKYQEETAEPLNLTETAKFLKVSRQTIVVWMKKGYLPSIKTGKQRFFRKEDIIAAIEKHNFSYNPYERINTKYGENSFRKVVQDYYAKKQKDTER